MAACSFHGANADWLTASEWKEGRGWQAESEHFGLRQRPPTPAIRSFVLMPRLRSMLDRANEALAQQFRGVTSGARVGGLFPLARTGISLTPVVEAARYFLSAYRGAAQGSVFCHRRR